MKLKSFQKAALQYCQGGPYNPLKGLKGKAAQYSGSYRRSLQGLEAEGLLEVAKGPRGGIAWITTPKGEEILLGENS